MTVVLPGDYESLSSIEELSIPWITDEQALREDIRALRIGMLNVMSMDEDGFKREFAGTPIMRRGLEGMKRNAQRILAAAQEEPRK